MAKAEDGFFEINIVSPERQAYSARAAQVLAPCEDGYIGVLAGHAPVLAALQPIGLLSVYENDAASVSRRFLVGSGFVEILPSRCTVLADRVADLDAVSLNDIESALADAEARKAGPDEGCAAAEADIAFWKEARERMRKPQAA
jgi:F-type H+-transporting ATPase subunit epsilon